MKMFDMSWGATNAWPLITHLGSASLLIPTLVITALGLRVSGQAAALRIWLLTIFVAIVATIVTKVLFFGWGIGSASLNFTGVSGHTLLATAVLPVLFGWLLASENSRFSLIAGVSFGALLSIGVGISRVVLGAHSVSEVILAWLIGGAVSGITLSALRSPNPRPWYAALSPALLLLAFGTTASTYLPTHNWEIDLSMFLSGHRKPYTRCDLLQSESRGASFSLEPMAGDKF